MPQIFVTRRDGEELTLQATNEQTAMAAITGGGVAEVEAICGGCCACATCHVYVTPEFYDRLPPISEDEQVMLEGTENYRPGASRLSCQIPMAALDGLQVTIAPEG